MTRTIRFGFTPDPDDAFAYYALVRGKVGLPGIRATFTAQPIDRLNRLALEGQLDVAAVSSAYFPFLAPEYDILQSGASVGRGYGPLLAATGPLSLEELSRLEVAVAGSTTTGAALLRLLFPQAVPVEVPFEELRASVEHGRFRAGVMVHEELLLEPAGRLRRVACLGALWTKATGLPLPVGLNVVRRSLGEALAARICRAVRDSVLYALDHPQEAGEYALGFGVRRDPGAAWKFIRLFTNEDTIALAEDVQAGLRELLSRLSAAGLAPPVATLSVVEPDQVPARSVPLLGARA